MRAKAVMLANTAITPMQTIEDGYGIETLGVDVHAHDTCGKCADCSDHHALGTLHEAHLALKAETLGTRTHVAHHD